MSGGSPKGCIEGPFFELGMSNELNLSWASGDLEWEVDNKIGIIGKMPPDCEVVGWLNISMGLCEALAVGLGCRLGAQSPHRFGSGPDMPTTSKGEQFGCKPVEAPGRMGSLCKLLA